MDNNLIASALREAAPAAAAVGAGLYAYQKKSSVVWATAAAFGGYVAVNYLRQRLLNWLEPVAELPVVPAALPAPITQSTPAALPEGAMEVQDPGGNVIALQRKSPDFSGGMRP